MFRWLMHLLFNAVTTLYRSCLSRRKELSECTKVLVMLSTNIPKGMGP